VPDRRNTPSVAYEPPSEPKLTQGMATARRTFSSDIEKNTHPTRLSS
jgi:hypothetical protein